MVSKAFVLLCFLGSISAAPEEILGCPSQCRLKFQDRELSGCETGCRLMSITDSLSMGFDRTEKMLSKCDESCGSSFGETKETVSACKQGCKLMVPSIESRRHKLNSPLESFFGKDGILRSLHLPQVFSDESGQESESGSFVQGMLSRMNEMMNAAMGGLSNVNFGRGKLVIIKSGPGYQETETYDLSPKSNLNDMMNKMNPLDNTMGNREDGDKADKDVFGVEFVDPVNTKYQKDRDLIVEPSLPETGLKTRVIHRDMCSAENKKWSEWVYCLHQRVGMPRWLIAASFSLGVVLALFLCMTIPQRASRRRITEGMVLPPSSSSKEALAKAKEAEANSTKIISLVSVSDLPPPYDDVSNLKVALYENEQDKASVKHTETKA